MSPLPCGGIVEARRKAQKRLLPGRVRDRMGRDRASDERQPAIRLHEDAAPIWLRELEGVPASAQADEARLLLAAHAKPPPAGNVLDLCCGTGLCAVAAARAAPSARVVAADVNCRFCAIVVSHAKRNEAENIVVEHSDGFDHLSDADFDEIYFYPPAHCSDMTVRKLIAQALLRLRVGGRLWLAAQRRAAGRGYRRWASAVFGGGARVARRRGCEVWVYRKTHSDAAAAAAKAEELAQQETHSYHTTVSGRQFHFRTKVNVFSWSGLDEGTRLLLESLPDARASRVLDLGCGYGPLGIVAARLYTGADVTMSDVDRRAVDLARINADANGRPQAHACISDGVKDLPNSRFDLILSNLPTHVGNRHLLCLLRGVHERLSPGGRFIAVISKQLTVDRVARGIFGSALTVAESASHRVFCCTKGNREGVGG